MSSRTLLVLLSLPLLAVALPPGAAASVPVGACVQQDHNACPGFVCAYVEAKYVCETPQPVSVGFCEELTESCGYGQLACANADGRIVCVEDPCSRDPELCHPALA